MGTVDTLVTPSPSPAPSSSSDAILSDAIVTGAADASAVAFDLGGCEKVDGLLIGGAVILSCLTALLGYSLGKKRTLKLMADSSNTSSLLADPGHTPLESPKVDGLPSKEVLSSTA